MGDSPSGSHFGRLDYRDIAGRAAQLQDGEEYLMLAVPKRVRRQVRVLTKFVSGDWRPGPDPSRTVLVTSSARPHGSVATRR